MLGNISLFSLILLLIVRFVLGQKVQKVPVSATALRTTSCCFGGPTMEELFVTSGSSENDKVGDAGSLFKVSNDMTVTRNR